VEHEQAVESLRAEPSGETDVVPRPTEIETGMNHDERGAGAVMTLLAGPCVVIVPRSSPYGAWNSRRGFCPSAVGDTRGSRDCRDSQEIR
jgi:hypothetical protein